MSSNLIKIIAGIFIVLAAILGFVAWQMGHNYADNSGRAGQPQQSAQNPAASPQIQIVMAIKPLPADQPIDAASVKLAGIDKDLAPQDFYLHVDDVIGRRPSIDIDTGTPITPRLLDRDPIAWRVPPGYKAVSLTLSDVIGVGGFLRPGDVVDVLVYLRNDQQNKVEPAQARILLKDAQVLGVDAHIVDPPNLNKNDQQQQQQQQQQRRERTVVVAVPDSEVTRVMLGANLGEVRLALHGRTPDQAPATQQAAAPAAAPAADTTASGAPSPTPVSGASLPQQTAATEPGKSDANSDLPDQPYTSADLGKLKPKHTAKGAPEGIVVYRGSKASTVYP